MDNNKCSHKRCNDPEELGCQIPGCGDFQDCEHWQSANNIISTKKKVTLEEDNEEESEAEEFTKKTIDTTTVNWTGNSMGLDNLWLIKQRSTPIIIGVVGLFSSGKTTFLSMIYLLLASGKRIGDFHFSGAYTLVGWENISWSMRWNKEGQFSFPAHTSANIGRNQGYLHLSLRKDNSTRDIIFTDVPGEWFAKWMENEESNEAKGANQIIREADGFIFFVDCEGLNRKNRLRTLIRSNTEQLASRLKDHLKERPIAMLWSKADTKEDINPKVLEKLENKLKVKFPNAEFFDISYQEGEKQAYHQNILETINWIIAQLENVPRTAIEIEVTENQDYFFKYRGR